MRVFKSFSDKSYGSKHKSISLILSIDGIFFLFISFFPSKRNRSTRLDKIR